MSIRSQLEFEKLCAIGKIVRLALDRAAAAVRPGITSWVPPVGLVYHPFVWRGFTDFGSGALRDIAPHHVKVVFQALDLSTLAFQSQTAVGEPVPIQAMPARLGSAPSRPPAA